MLMTALMIFTGAGVLGSVGAGGALAWRNHRYTLAGAWPLLKQHGTLVGHVPAAPPARGTPVKTPKAEVINFPTNKGPVTTSVATVMPGLTARPAVMGERVLLDLDLSPARVRQEDDGTGGVPMKMPTAAPAPLTLPFARMLPIGRAPEVTPPGPKQRTDAIKGGVSGLFAGLPKF